MCTLMFNWPFIVQTGKDKDTSYTHTQTHTNANTHNCLLETGDAESQSPFLLPSKTTARTTTKGRKAGSARTNVVVESNPRLALSKSCQWTVNDQVLGEGDRYWPSPRLSMTKEASSGRPLQELSMTKEASGDRPLQELSITKDASSGRPLQQWLNQEATPWINPAQNPLLERSPSRLESQQRLTGEQIN